MYPGGACELGRWICGGVQHKWPNVLPPCQKHRAADQRGPRGELQGVSDRSLLGMKPSWGIYFDELMSPIPEMSVVYQGEDQDGMLHVKD